MLRPMPSIRPFIARLSLATWSILCAWCMLPDPASAQQQRTGLRETIEQMTRTEREQAEAARRWAMERRLPTRILQPDGGVVELVGVHNGFPRYISTLNQRAAALTHTDQLYPGAALDLGLTGRDMRIGIWDAGHVQETHPEMAGRVVFGDDAPVGNHATHVGGTLIASGIRPEARGMAYEARLVSFDWRDDVAEMDAQARAGLLVSNHSYSAIAGWFFGTLEAPQSEPRWYWLGDPNVSVQEDASFGTYDVEALQFDRVAHANPYLLPVVAAGNDRIERGPASGPYRGYDRRGNLRTLYVESDPRPPDGGMDGYDTVAGSSVAKNVLTVGSFSVDGAGVYRHPSSFSSYGPTDDGRIKPDLAGFGEGLLSTQADERAPYVRLTGTSMSTPNVSGTAILLQQYHHALKGSYMRAATLKGLLLHTAQDVDAPGPDYRTGWGLLDAAAAALHLQGAIGNNLALLESTLEQGQVFRKKARRDAAGPLRVTLVWTDPPGTLHEERGPARLDAFHRALRNDLDLRLIDDETGEVHFPYRLDRDAPAQPAVRGDNTVDNVEQVYLPDATSTSFTLVVSHKDSLVGGFPQLFSLIVSGAYDDLVPVSLTHLDAVREPETTVLTWQTHFERVAGTFVVERASVTYPPEGGRQVGVFTYVGEVPGHGAAAGVQTYSYRDRHAEAGRYVYRVVFADEEGTRYQSTEIEVNVPPPERTAVVSSYPNPFRDQVTVVIDLPRGTSVVVDLFDGLGRRIEHLYTGELPAGRHHLPVTLSHAAPGLYLLRIQTGETALHHPILRTD